jgi:hypothetical protein
MARQHTRTLSGPGPVQFADPASPQTAITVTTGAAGDYLVGLTAFDGTQSQTATTHVFFNAFGNPPGVFSLPSGLWITGHDPAPAVQPDAPGPETGRDAGGTTHDRYDFVPVSVSQTVGAFSTFPAKMASAGFLLFKGQYGAMAAMLKLTQEARFSGAALTLGEYPGGDPAY